MLYKTPSHRPRVNLFQDATRGSARLALQLPDLQALANALVPNLGNNAKTRHCTNIESKELRSEATEPSGERRLLPPSPSPEGRDLGRG